MHVYTMKQEIFGTEYVWSQWLTGLYI